MARVLEHRSLAAGAREENADGMTAEQRPPATSPNRGLVIGLVTTVILAGVAVTVLALILIGRESATAGDDGSPTPTVNASGSGSETSAVPTGSVSAEPTAAATPPPLAPDSIALVTVNDLNMREDPAAGAKSLGHLTAGTRVFVVQGPNQADGLGWYQIAQECRPHSSTVHRARGGRPHRLGGREQ